MSGARFDAPGAPADALLMARRGMSQCLRLLAGLSDTALDVQDRRVLIAGLSYDARDLAEALAARREGRAPPVVSNPERRLAYGISLPTHALRYLFQHTGIHLDVEWRDLPGPLWSQSIAWQDGGPAAHTPMIRAKALWRASFALGGQARDVPAPLRDQV